jgi:hypothetical protein
MPESLTIRLLAPATACIFRRGSRNFNHLGLIFFVSRGRAQGRAAPLRFAGNDG